MTRKKGSSNARQRSLMHGPSHSECYSGNIDPSDPSDLAYYRALNDYLEEGSFASFERVGSLEKVGAGSLPDDAPVSPPPGDVALLRIASLFSFVAKRQHEDTGEKYLDRLGMETSRYATAAVILLAAHHFNTGDGRVVAEVGGIDDRCPVRIVVDFHDTETDAKSAVDAMTKQILSDPTGRLPSAIIGAFRSSITIPLASLTGVYGIPQISPSSTSTELDDTNQFPLFSRLLPSDAGTARALVAFARERSSNGLNFMGVLYKNNAFGSAYHLAIKEAAEYEPGTLEKIRVEGVHYSSPHDIDLAVRTLAETGYRFFVGIFFTADYEPVMESAVKHGIAGPGHVWILSDGMSATMLSGKTYPSGSPLAIASQGIGIIRATGGRHTKGGETGFDRFTDAYYTQKNDAVDYYNCVGHPRENSMNASIYFQADGGFFTDRKMPPPSSSFFAYDSVISLGLAACRLLGDEEGDTDEAFGGEQLMDQFLRQEFEGASGFVSVDPDTHSRRPETAFFVLYNVIGEIRDNVTAFSLEKVANTLSNRDSNSDSISWVDFPGKAFIYSDGTSKFPPTLPPIMSFDEHHLSSAIRGVFLFLASIIIVLSILFSGWTFHHRMERVVSASQPLFLYMICLGVIIMSSTIITLSIDDGIASQRGCDVACMLNPWFLAVGFVIAFSSLFAKEWRINKIFHNPSMKRMKVSPKDVILPCAILLGLNIVVLSIWTSLSPLTWNRFFVGAVDKYGRKLGSLGMCIGESEDWVPYVAALLIMDVTLVLLANFQAFQARHISMEFSESKYIAVIMIAILQAVAIGLPLVILVSDDPTASFVIRSGIIFVISASFLLVTFVPKIFYLRDARAEAIQKEERKRESRKRHTEMLARSRTHNQASAPSLTSTTQREDSDLSIESGPLILRHPKVQGDEVQALKAELGRAKDREEEMRRTISQLEQGEKDKQNCNVDATDIDSRSRSVTFKDEELP